MSLPFAHFQPALQAVKGRNGYLKDDNNNYNDYKDKLLHLKNNAELRQTD